MLYSPNNSSAAPCFRYVCNPQFFNELSYAVPLRTKARQSTYDLRIAYANYRQASHLTLLDFARGSNNSQDGANFVLQDG